MTTNIVASSDAKAQLEFEGWENVPKDFQTRSGWDTLFRKVRNGEKPTATVITLMRRKLACADAEYVVPKQHALYHRSQTRPIKPTALNLSRHAFWQYFVQPADRSRLIRWTKGEWREDEEGNRIWESEADVWGWKTYEEWFGKAKAIDHTVGSDLYGAFGAEKSFYLMIDLDLHKKPLTLFLRRLAVLLDAFHGKHACHFQVSDEDAGGVHLILFFGKTGLLKTRHHWIENELSDLDERHPGAEFFRTKRGKRKLNIEVFPSTSDPHRLPLARGRTMLLDRPLPLVSRRGREVQDVEGYIRWLNDPIRQYMPKDDVFRHIIDRLDLSCSSSCSQKSGRTSENGQSQKSVPSSEDGTSEVAASEIATSEKRRYPLKGRTRGAIVGYWQRGEPGQFRHLNAAVLVTLRALRAEGIDRSEAVETVMRYVEELPNDRLSCRLPDDMPKIGRDVERAAAKIWNAGISGIWKRTAQRWAEIGFRVSDKGTWAVSGKTPEVIVDCEEIGFTEAERRLIADQLAPILVGPKQAKKPDKVETVERAVAHFLRYVRCCDREIPMPALPDILSGFGLKLRNHDKQRWFLKKLCEVDWIYQRADYYHPARHGGKASTGRARAYGIGKAMAGKFGSPLPPNNKREEWIYILSPTFCEATRSEVEIPSFDEQMAESSIFPA